MLNKFIGIGRLTRDPELRYTQNGIPVSSFTIAIDRPFSGQGQQERETDFIDCVAWRKLAEVIANHLQKGRLIGVEGRVQVRSYETPDGQKRRATEIVADNVHFLDRPKEGGNGSSQGGQAPTKNVFEDLDLDDDVPF